MPVYTTMFGVVRKNKEGREFLSLSEFDCTRVGVHQHIEDTARETPNWDADHPVVRFVKCEVREIAELKKDLEGPTVGEWVEELWKEAKG